MNREYRLAVVVWQPTGEINLLSDDLKEQVAQAIEAYNKRYGGFKALQLIEVTKSRIELKLTVVVPVGEKVDVSRAIGFFSKQLYHTHGWSQFSKVANRLFTVIESEEITPVQEEQPLMVRDEETAIYQVSNRSTGTSVEKDIRAARLKWLYATKEYIELEIKQLEAMG